MNRDINKKELFELYKLMEEMNDFFHQPDNFKSIDQVTKFAHGNYSSIKKMYYKTIWNWLTKQEQEQWMALSNRTGKSVKK